MSVNFSVYILSFFINFFVLFIFRVIINYSEMPPRKSTRAKRGKTVNLECEFDLEDHGSVDLGKNIN